MLRLHMGDDDIPPEAYPPFHEKDDTIGVSDQYEMVTKFAMEQNLSHYGYGDRLSHINKNLLFTNLSRKNNEPELVMRQLKNITILKRFINEDSEMVPTGQYEEVGQDEGTVYAREIYVEHRTKRYRWLNLINYCSTKVYGQTSVAAGTDGKLLETLKSTFLHKEQTIEDKTQTTRGFWGSVKKQR